MNSPRSGLFYFGTTDEVCLGDEVEIRRWFRRPLRGFVCYLPNVSPRHPAIDFGTVRQWGIRLQDGTILLSVYAPERVRPRPNLRLLRRTDEPGLQPGEPLE